MLLTTITFSACSKYQQVLKSSDLNKLEMAKKYYDEEQFFKALPIFDELNALYRGTSKQKKCTTTWLSLIMDCLKTQ